MLAVRRYLRFALSYRDVEEFLAERGIDVDHVTDYRWVQRFTPLLVDAARPCLRSCGDRWLVDETYVKIAGHWTYLYRAVDQHGQVIDVLASTRRDQAAARRFFTTALSHARRPVEVTTDKAAVYPRLLDELLPEACHVDAARENNRIEADHGRLKARLRPMRGLKRLRSVRQEARRMRPCPVVDRDHRLAAGPATQAALRGRSGPLDRMIEPCWGKRSPQLTVWHRAVPGCAVTPSLTSCLSARTE
ncbi:Integrase (modular protein) [Frankia canadensis]|uniref:Integrase (Modular protein) n=1 Tax=Frankia canadensis TaxID=1836972 RepID=A0A2I2L1L6_9ACTN|nr:Integrase (modular protein) [Frankia canadensis]SOU59101.1 Integrase (modular protein) [Frankia canadensis]